MPEDTLSVYARSQPGKPGVIDDRPDGTIVTWTYAELEAQSNRVANLLLSLGADAEVAYVDCEYAPMFAGFGDRLERVRHVIAVGGSGTTGKPKGAVRKGPPIRKCSAPC
jgi:acyl-coenzyme A synthetase/AMP-(fatty) acid ligase